MKNYRLFYIPAVILSLLLSTSCKDVKSTQQKKKESDAMTEFEKAAEETKRQQAKELETTGELSGDPAVMDRVIEASKKLEAASTGDEAKSAKVMRLFMEDVQKDMVKLSSLQERLVKASIYAAVKTPEDIDKLSAEVKLYQEANAELTAKIKSGWLAELRSNLEKEGLKKSFINEFMRGAKKGLNKNKDSLLLIRKLDDQLCEAILKQHTILKKSLGKWQWNATDEVPDFEDDIALYSYNEQAIKIQKVAEQQTEVQKKLLNVK